jgi:hypothetical protein
MRRDLGWRPHWGFGFDVQGPSHRRNGRFITEKDKLAAPADLNRQAGPMPPGQNGPPSPPHPIRREGLPSVPGVDVGKPPRFIGQPVEPLATGEKTEDEPDDDPPEGPVASVWQLDELLRKRRRVVRCEIFRAGEVRCDDLLVVFHGRMSALRFVDAVLGCPQSAIVLREVLADVRPGMALGRVGAHEIGRQLALLIAEGLVRVAVTIEEIPDPIGPSSGGSPSPARSAPVPAPEPAPLRPAPRPWKPQSPSPTPAPVVSTLPGSVDLSIQVERLRSASARGTPICEICERSRASAAASSS